MRWRYGEKSGGLMKCRRCGQSAAVNMRQYKLALCKPHYLDWFREQTERFIGKYKMFTRDERVLVAVSGGKDSLALWDVLIRLGYRTGGLYIDLGIDEGIGYSDLSQEKVQKFVADRPGLPLEVVDVAQLYGATVPVAAGMSIRGRGRPCSVCGMTKRHIMNRVALDGGYDVLVTGHNLDDEVAVLFGNTLHWQVEYLARQGPVLPAAGGNLVRKAKPFCRFYERETAAYALLAGIDYIYDECPFASGATTLANKDMLNRLEEHHPGTKLQFYLGFLRAKEAGAFPSVVEQSSLRVCPTCGQPTSADDRCSFCRTWEHVRARVVASAD